MNANNRKIQSPEGHSFPGVPAVKWAANCVAGLGKLLFFLGSGFLTLGTLYGCMADDDYSFSATDRLLFSQDTVRLDTVISGQPTNTYTFCVYNPYKKAIRLSSVFLEQGGQSPFRVNVDGVSMDGGSVGPEAEIEIESEDSIRVFLFGLVPETHSDTPVKTEDKLVFVTEGGVAQEVVLSAYGQDVVPLNGTVGLTGDTLLSSRRPYLIADSLVVAEGSTLTIEPGVRLLFHPGADLIVRGTLLARGTVDSPVVMRGDRMGYMFSQQPYDRIPGQWGGVVFASESYGNRLEYCDIHSGTYGIVCDSSDVDKETLRLENSVVHNVSGDVLFARSARIFVGNSQLTNAGGDCVSLVGGHSTFVHCTIGSFYSFTGGRGVALSFTNEEMGMPFPLQQAAFLNCLITGYSADEVMGNQSERYADAAFNYRFDHCLLDTPEAESEHITNCLWDNDEKGHEVWREKNFSPDFDFRSLLFSFMLSGKSQAVDHAHPETALQYYPLDRNGKSRLADDGPDIGCYEYVPAEGEENPEDDMQ